MGNPMDRGAWRARVHGVAKSCSWLSNWACKHSIVQIVRSPGLEYKLLGNFWLSERWDDTRKDFWEVNAVVWGELKQQGTGHDLKHVCKILLTWWPAQKPNSEAICLGSYFAQFVWNHWMGIKHITQSGENPGLQGILEGICSSLHG